MKKNIIICVLWVTSLLITSITTIVVTKNKRLAIIEEAKEIAGRVDFSEADMTIFYVDHGEGIEQIAWMEGARDSVAIKKAEDEKLRQLLKSVNLQQSLAEQSLLASKNQSLADLYKKAYETLNSAIITSAAGVSEQKTEVERPSNYGSSVPSGAINNGASLIKAKEPDQPSPNWQIPTRSQALAIVKASASAKWASDFSMVEYELKKQMEAYDKLQQYQKQTWKPLMRTLLNDAAKKWKDDYNMIVYELEKQIDAKAALEGR